MEARTHIVADDFDSLWAQLAPDFADAEKLHNYHVTAQLPAYTIDIDMSSSPGGGAGGGYGVLQLHAPVPHNEDFVFVIYPDDFLNKIGKLFGMQDVFLGFDDFDEQVIVKTNSKSRLYTVFNNAELRRVYAALSGYSLRLDDHEDTDEPYLDFTIQRAVMDPAEFQQVLKAFIEVLQRVQ